jgi:outer membrane protein assembly factor BamA
MVCILGLAAGSRAQNSPQPPPPAVSNFISGVIESVEIHGARRIPQDMLRVLLASRLGDTSSEETLRRDFTTLWNTMRFDDIKVETLRSERGGVIVRFIVTERAVQPVARISPVSTEAVLERFNAH